MMRKAAAILSLAILAACAPKIVPAPVVTSPKYPDFLTPAVPPALASEPAALNEDRGWRFLQAGDLKTAEKEFAAALKLSPTFYPADAALGYVALARKDPKSAVPYFDRALERQASYAPALVGKGQALLGLNRTADALTAFEAAVAADPALTDIRRRVDVLKFRSVEQNLKQARDAAHAGRTADAIKAYDAALASSPDSPFLYRELADVERQAGNGDQALAHYRKAVSLDPSDAASWAHIGDLLAASSDFTGAETAYSKAIAIDPGPALQAKLDDARDKAALAALPAEYRAIPDAPQITRADLAALIGVRLSALVQGGHPRDAVLITDVRSSWAAPWIMAVARAGIMEPFANHAFQPRAVVRRIDVAQAVSRIVERLPHPKPAWLSARVKFTDLSSGHLAYPAASVAVASGVMMTTPDHAFQPSKPVSGADAIAIIGRLEVLAAGAAASGAPQ